MIYNQRMSRAYAYMGGQLSYKMRVRLRMTCIWRYNVWVGWVVRGVGEGIKGQGV